MESLIVRARTAVLILVLLLMGVAAFNFLSETFPVIYSHVLVIIGLILYGTLYLRGAISAVDTLERKKSKIRHRSVLISALTVFLAVSLNLAAFRYNVKLDLTETRAFTFSDYTRQVLRNLKKPVQMKVFTRESQVTPDLEFYLNRFTEETKNFTFEFIDPNRDPKQAEQYGIKSQQNVAVLICGEREERLYSFHERAISAALTRVQQEEPKKVYFTSGHGEQPTEEYGREGVGTLCRRLRQENYKPESLLLVQTGMVPEDAEIVVIAGPVSDFLPEEVRLLEGYLDTGGRLLCLLDPSSTGNLVDLLSQWGVRLREGSISDESGAGRMLGAGPELVFAAQYGLHPITENYGIATFFPLARPVEAEAGSKGSATSIVFTSDQVNYKDPQSEENRKGPLSLAVAGAGKVEDAPRETRVAVFGDSDFVNNLFLPKQGNLDLILNTFRWLSQDEMLIGRRPADTKERVIRFDQRYFMVMFYVLLFVLPILSAGTGFYFWSRRRNLR